MSRIYRVDVIRTASGKDADIVDSVERSYLVETYSPWQAQKHVAKKYINAKTASAHDVAELMAKGVKVEAGAAKPDPATTTGADSK